jgi:hypothetical protein
MTAKRLFGVTGPSVVAKEERVSGAPDVTAAGSI